MAQFKCLVSGNVVNFEHAHDIVEMHKHPQYEFVEPKVQAKAPEGLVKEKTVAVKSIFKD
jgi:hypothetical protein